MGSNCLARRLLPIIRACLPLDLILPDQPNRHLRHATAKPVRAKTGPVRVVVWEGRPYPDMRLNGYSTCCLLKWIP